LVRRPRRSRLGPARVALPAGQVADSGVDRSRAAGSCRGQGQRALHSARGHAVTRLTLLYVLTLAAAAGLFLLIRAHGETLSAPKAGPANRAVDRGGANLVDATPYLLLTLAAVIVLGRAIGWLFALVGQPPVIGEVIAGIVLGPSVLGQIVPDG